MNCIPPFAARKDGRAGQGLPRGPVALPKLWRPSRRWSFCCRAAAASVSSTGRASPGPAPWPF